MRGRETSVKVSIVIPAYNAAATLDECLTACTHQSYSDLEIIVVDDGSTDATSVIAHSYCVHLVLQEQCGPAAARNTGVAASHGDIIAFTDSDCVPHPDWIERLIAPLTGEVAAAGGTYGIANPESALARLIHAEIMLRHAHFGGRVDFVGSYNAAIRRDVFEALHGFDTDFKAASAEDNDLCYRLADAGHAIAFVRDAVVDHFHPTGVWRYLRTQSRHGFWRMKLYAKHPERKSGDRYASGIELWAPVYAVVSLAALAATAFIQNVTLSGAMIALILQLYVYRVFTATHIARIDRAISISFAATVLFLRDYARGFGLAAGCWHFLIMRKATA